MRTFVVSVATLALFGGCEFKCSTGGFSTKKLQKKIEATLAGLGVKATAECPKIEKNSTATCTAKTPDGKTIIVEVKTDDKTANFQTKNLLVGTKLEPEIANHYKTTYQMTFDSVKCPKVIIAGDDATCTATAQGVKIPFKLAAGPQGARYDPVGGVLIGPKAEAAIAKGLGGAKVACGFKLKVSKPGSRFTCNAEAPDGKKATIHVKVTDANGGIKMGMTPPE